MCFVGLNDALISIPAVPTSIAEEPKSFPGDVKNSISKQPAQLSKRKKRVVERDNKRASITTLIAIP